MNEISSPRPKQPAKRSMLVVGAVAGLSVAVLGGVLLVGRGHDVAIDNGDPQRAPDVSRTVEVVQNATEAQETPMPLRDRFVAVAAEADPSLPEQLR